MTTMRTSPALEIFVFFCLPSSAKQDREMTKFCVVCGTTAIFVVFAFGTECCHWIFSLSKILEPLVH